MTMPYADYSLAVLRQNYAMLSQVSHGIISDSWASCFIYQHSILHSLCIVILLN